MVTVVVVINVSLSLVCFYVAWRIVKLRSRLSRLTNKIIAAERKSHAILHNAPVAILKGQRGSQRLQERYQQLEYKLRRLQQVLALLSVLQQIWLGRSRGRKSKLPNRVALK